MIREGRKERDSERKEVRKRRDSERKGGRNEGCK